MAGRRVLGRLIAQWSAIGLGTWGTMASCSGRTHGDEPRPDASVEDVSTPESKAFRCQDGAVEEALRINEDGAPTDWRFAHECSRGCRLDIADFVDGDAPNEFCEEARYGECEFVEHFRCRNGVVEYPRFPCESGEWASALTCAEGCRTDLSEMDLWQIWYPVEVCKEFADAGLDAK